MNHFKGRHTLDVLAAVLGAVSQTRPDVLETALIISGRREGQRRRSSYLPAGITRALASMVLRRWRFHLIRLPLGNRRSSLKALRTWKQKSKLQPTFVFPEGKASIEFRSVRPGSGAWLFSLGLPVLPCGVWEGEGGIQVRIGPPIKASPRPELLDLQLGLNIASLLPTNLAVEWQERLAQWKASHAKSAEVA